MQLCILAAMLAGAAAFLDVFDAQKVNEMLSDSRLAETMECVLDKGPCTPDGYTLKSTLYDALHEGCKLCTKIERSSIKKALGYLMNLEQRLWQQVVDKYDPQGNYAGQYEKELMTEVNYEKRYKVGKHTANTGLEFMI